jgi:hypothetical protein
MKKVLLALHVAWMREQDMQIIVDTNNICCWVSEALLEHLRGRPKKWKGKLKMDLREINYNVNMI